MPRSSLHTLTWSQDHATYELSTHDHLQHRFLPEDEKAWFSWLETASSFAFHSASGYLNVYQEARPRGGGYWYAYRTTSGRTHKRYLGRTASVTFARLEEVAQALSSESSALPLPSSLVPEFPQDGRDAADRQTLSAIPHTWLPGMLLLSLRLSPPLLPPALVARERLLTRLDAALSHRLTLLSASAGWGKTTLLSMWAARSPFPLAWLSLDELDNEPIRFWVSVLAALRTCLPGVGETAASMLRSSQSPRLTAIVLTLLHELGALTQPLVLLVDDYYLIEDQAIHDSLLFLLERLPVHLHLVLASRIDPPLALARWRVRGQLLELRDADLRFQEEEVAHFFAQAMNLPLSQENVALLSQRTEGWAAGLQLAALSMQHHEDHSAFVQGFAGTHRHVLDYVQEEILARLPTSLQHFLPQIAILNKISAPLCQAITGEVESALLLEQAERANLFLVPLDEERRWYRMHDLFRGALLARLRARHPEMVTLLHQRAARFYEEQGEIREAISHALEASDFWPAARLMERALGETWLAGESQIFSRWVMALPLTVIRKHARFALTAALYVLNVAASTEPARIAQAQTQVEQMMERVEAAVLRDHPTHISRADEPLPAADLALLRQRLLLLPLWGELMGRTLSGTFEEYRRAVARMEQLDLEDDIIWQMIPLSTTFIWRWTKQGEGTSLILMFEAAWERVRQSGNYFAIFKVQQWLSAIYLRVGKLRLAYQVCQAALDRIAQIRGYALLGGYPSAWLIEVLYEWNRLDEARSVARKLIHNAQIGQQIDLHVTGYMGLLKIELAAGELDSAQQVMQQLTALMQETGWNLQWLPLMQVTYWIGTGELAQAAHWATHAAFHQETMVITHRHKLLLLARVSLRLQQYRAALDILERQREQLDQPEDISTTISFLALSVAALHQLGEREAAQTTLMRLLHLSESEGYIHVYLNEGQPMREALQDFFSTPPAVSDPVSAALRSYASQLLAIFAQEAQQHALRSHEQSDAVHSQDGSQGEASSLPALLEPLTSQEQRVLRLLAAGRSNQEIARLLVISLNTVKTHIKNLYSKLHVSNRAQASALARALRLL